jgi:IclR family acetate operon transcriptional repressor
MRNKPEPPLLNESVDRALQLIVFLREAGTISVKDAAEHLAVAPSTAHRLLTTLMQRHFAEQLPDRRYRPGREIVNDSADPITIARLREIARPSMMSLAQSLQETVQLAIPRGGNIEFVDGVEGENLLRVSCRFGVQIPAFASAGGKALLAEMTDTDIEHLYIDGVPSWPTSDIETVSALIEKLSETRSAGYGTNFEESESGIIGIGSAIYGPQGEALGALTVAIPASRFQSTAVPQIAQMLRQATAQITDRFEYRSSLTRAHAAAE